MKNYYSNLLNSNKLQKCYEIAPLRVKQFLEAEIAFVISKIRQNDTVLDLGCGYGRVSTRLSDKARKVIGIDISKDNIDLAKKLCRDNKNCAFYIMNAIDLNFTNNEFDLTICVQNGISAFKVAPDKLLKEAIRVTKKGGIILFSSYSDRFWNDRLEWFKIQSDQGLIGKIDFSKTKNGVIICHDGFKAITYSGKEFIKLASNFDVETKTFEIDNSSVFCEMIVN